MALNEFFQAVKEEKKITLHYYGDLVRALFLLAAIVMLVTLPFVAYLLPVQFFTSIVVILFLSIFAALTNPKQKWTAILNNIVSIVGFLIMEYYAIISFYQYSVASLLFWTNQILSIIFLLSLYYGTKTLRGMLQRKS